MTRLISICGALLLASCSDERQCPERAACEPSVSDEADVAVDSGSAVLYVGGTTDEALLHLSAMTVTDSPAHRLVLDSPTSAELSAGAPAEFTFHVQGVSGQLPRLGGTPEGGAKGGGSTRWASRSLRELWHLVGPMRAAYAHGAPYNGQAFLLRFANPDDDAVLSVFTAQGTYRPTIEQWAELARHGSLSLRIIWASFEENEVARDGGPFYGLELQFEIR